MRDAPNRSGAGRRPPMPLRKGRLDTWQLALLAFVAMTAWWGLERTSTSALHPQHATMLTAARTMAAAMDAIHAAKERRGLLVDPQHDPNATGLIGPQWSPVVTTHGDLVAKRTATNPDLAAALAGELAQLAPQRGDTLVTVMSGSLVGANVAVLSAAEALDLHVIAISSLGASMWGATDPEFTWLDMEAAMRGAGVVDVHSRLSVLGGDMALGIGIGEEGTAALRASAERHDVPLWEAANLDALTQDVVDFVAAEIDDVQDVRAFVNVGGSMLSMGMCREAAGYPVGLSSQPLPCRNGTPGLMTRMSMQGVPVLHVLNLDELALRFGLPVDPRPLPTPGNDRHVYGHPRP